MTTRHTGPGLFASDITALYNLVKPMSFGLDRTFGAYELNLWNFALAYYRRPGVAEACLILQDRAGVDVNVMIYVLWRIAVRGDHVDSTAIAAADEVVAQWRKEIVQPLRLARRALKTGPAPAPNSSTETLRGRIKAIEIDAEHIELDWLEQQVGGSGSERKSENVMSESLKALRSVVRFYSDADSTDIEPAIDTLVAAL